MALTSFFRGATIEFTVSFLDSNGDTATPPSADVRIAYSVNGVATTTETSLTLGASTWTATWDSGVADEGIIHWHVRSDGSSKAAEDGRFKLLANDANDQT